MSDGLDKSESRYLKLAIGILTLLGILFLNFGLPHLRQSAYYAENGTSHKEQAIIEVYNPKLDKLSGYLEHNETHDEQIPTIPVTFELIDLINQLIDISPSNNSHKEELAGFYINIAGESQDPAQTVEYTELAIKTLETILESGPEMYTSPESKMTREYLFYSYLGLIQSDKNNVELNKERALRFTDKIPVDERNSYRNLILSSLTPATRLGWTEERVETLERLWKEGYSAAAIAKELGGVTRNAVIGKIHRSGFDRD